MASQTPPEIILYDLACTKNVCFSPTVWRIRLMLNYKQIPYKTVFLEFPDIEPTLKELGVTPPSGTGKYTVPTIHHIPTSTYLMDSNPISQFLESVYPTPAVPLPSATDAEILAKTRAILGPLFRTSLTPRELNVLSPRSQEYFRRTREEILRCKIGDEEEERAWKEADGELKGLSELLVGREKELDYLSFVVAGALQAARVVDEGVWGRVVRYEGFRGVYEVCVPFMERKD